MGKYFKYAIGEILLVVIGILIALQINNWNEQREERLVERKLLLEYKAELDYNHESLNFTLNDLKIRENRCQVLLGKRKEIRPVQPKQLNTSMIDALSIALCQSFGNEISFYLPFNCLVISSKALSNWG